MKNPKGTGTRADQRQINIWFKASAHDYIAKLAREAGISKAQFIRGIVLDVLADDAKAHGQAFER